MRTIAILLLCAAAIQAAEVSLPDACDGPVCLQGMRWKKGTVEHNLTGTIAPKAPLQAVELTINWADDRQQGVYYLRFRDVTKPTPFHFKLFGGGLLTTGKFQWDRSTVRVTAHGVSEMAGQAKDGIACTFRALGSRLKVTIKNSTATDAVLEYPLLTLISGGETLHLNGTHGKYTDLDKPNPPTLIPAGASVTEEFIPFGSAKLTNGEWIEDWALHQAMFRDAATLALPLSMDGKVRIEKIPIEFHSAGKASSEAKGTTK